MNKIILITSVGFLAIMGNALAQDSNTSVENLPTVSVSDPVNGVQVGVRKGLSAKVKLKAEWQGSSYTGSSSDFEQKYGFSVGYAKHSLESLGFKGSLNYDSIEDEDGDDAATLNGEANATLMINQHAIPYVGLNFGKFVSGDAVKDLDAGLGYQVGITGQLVKQLSYQLSYQVLNNDGEFDEFPGLNIDTELKTTTVGLIYTL